MPRPEEEEILRFLRERVWGPEKQAFGVVIAAPPVAGKTRTAIELVIRLNPPFVLVWPRGRKEGPSSFPSGVALPVPRAVVLADDLPLSPGGEGPSMPEELTALLSACPGLALIATARQDRIPPDVRGVHVIELREMPWDERLEGLAQAVAWAENRPLGEVRRRFTGTSHPGSLAAGLDVFRQRYEDLRNGVGRVLRVEEAAERDRLGWLGRRFLQSARALWDLGVRTLTLERVWAVVEKAGEEHVAPADRGPVLEALEKLAFLHVERGKGPEVARVYEGVLTEVIPSPGAEWEQAAWEALWERGDSAAFVEIGNTWSEEYGLAYQRNPREALRRAMVAYGEALRFRKPDGASLDYAETQNILGLAYRRLSEHEAPVENLRRAIEAFEEALRFRTPGVAPLDYARTQHNLGGAYWRLSEHEDPVGNLRRAIEAFEEALRFRTPDVVPLAYARTQHNLGLVYWHLSEHEDPVGNLRRAIEAFEEALRFRTPGVAPLDYAKTQHNLGLAYWRLSEHEDPVGNLRKAIAAYGEALRFQTPDVAPLDYARTQNNLGVAYRCLSEHEDPAGNLRRAIQALEEALRFRTPERTPLFYARTQYEMSLAYRQRAELQTDRAQRCMDLQAAVRAFREALRFRTPEAAPRWHEETCQALEEAEEALRRAGCPGSP